MTRPLVPAADTPVGTVVGCTNAAPGGSAGVYVRVQADEPAWRGVDGAHYDSSVVQSDLVNRVAVLLSWGPPALPPAADAGADVDCLTTPWRIASIVVAVCVVVACVVSVEHGMDIGHQHGAQQQADDRG